jgi:drug/metabolite transporter (DMT)-like permease
VVYVVWGSTYLAIRVGVRDIPPFGLAGARYLIAGALLFPIAIRTGDARTRAEDRPGWRQWVACGLIGMLLPALGNGGLTFAETTVPSGLAAMLVATVPLWMILFAVPIQRRRVSRRALCGLLIGLLGVIVLASGGSTHTGGDGVLIVLGASAAWGLGSALGGRLQLPRRALLAAAMEMLVGGAALTATAAVTGELGHPHLADIRVASWLALAYLIIPGSILAFTAYNYALTHLPVDTVSTYAYVNPVVAVILGAALLHENGSLHEAIGAALIISSVVLALRHRRADPALAPRGDPDRPKRQVQPVCDPRPARWRRRSLND